MKKKKKVLDLLINFEVRVKKKKKGMYVSIA